MKKISVIAFVVMVVLAFGAIVFQSARKSWSVKAAPATARAERKASPAILLDSPTPPGDRVALRTAAERAPKDAAAQSRLGDAHLAAGDFDEAITTYKRALAIDANRSGDWSGLGEAYVQTVRSTTPSMPPQARQAFDRAIAIDPGDLRAQFYQIMEKDFTGQHDQALNAWLAMLVRVPPGSKADQAIRGAITASVGRNVVMLRNRMEDAIKAQKTRFPVKPAAPAAKS